MSTTWAGWRPWSLVSTPSSSTWTETISFRRTKLKFAIISYIRFTKFKKLMLVKQLEVLVVGQYVYNPGINTNSYEKVVAMLDKLLQL